MAADAPPKQNVRVGCKRAKTWHTSSQPWCSIIMPSQPFPASWLVGLTVWHSLPAPAANNHDAAAYEEREASAGWRIISAQLLKKQSVHTAGRIRACRKYELSVLTKILLVTEHTGGPEAREQIRGLNAATAGELRKKNARKFCTVIRCI